MIAPGCRSAVADTDDAADDEEEEEEEEEEEDVMGVPMTSVCRWLSTPRDHPETVHSSWRTLKPDFRRFERLAAWLNSSPISMLSTASSELPHR